MSAESELLRYPCRTCGAVVGVWCWNLAHRKRPAISMHSDRVHQRDFKRTGYAGNAAQVDPSRMVAHLDAIETDDPEAAHAEADALLLAYVHPDIKAAYDRVAKRCARWAAA